MSNPIVRTCAGEVRGIGVAGVERFFGVPYAAAPLGDCPWPEYDAETQNRLALETGEVRQDASMPAAAWI